MENKAEIEYLGIESLIPYARNSRTHSDEQVAQIAASIREFGFTNPVLVDGQGGIIAGHGRVLAARKLGLGEVPCIRLGHLTEAQKKAYVIADNKLALNAGWDNEMLALELQELEDMGYDLDLTGFSDEEIEALALGVEGDVDDEGAGGAPVGSLSDKFMLPPFSVLNAREGWWQKRKESWLALGIRSEQGRSDSSSETGGLLMKSWTAHPDFYRQKAVVEGKLGRKLSTAEFSDGHFVPPTDGAYASGTSIFDPVVCEIAYRWFSPDGGIVLDPFAGGSVRGIVASKLGRQYVGHELRQEQVTSNREQGSEICGDAAHPPAWVCGDSRGITSTCHDVQADLVFSCPPYADLEVYSDDPKDLSTLGYEEFRSAYFEIIKKTCSLLKENRFACFVIGEVRDKKGNYYDFVGDTVQAFREAGLHYYNEAILVTAIGSLPIRAGKQFSVSRKLGKTHQNILVFVKGDAKKAALACGDVHVDESLFESDAIADV